MDAYADWSSDNVKNEVVLPYVSMHGSTAAMAERLIEALVKRNIKVMPFNLTKTDLGELAISLVDAATIVIGSPTVLTGPHPAAVSATFVANALRPKTRFASLIGSYGWAGKMPEVLTGMLGNLKVELIPPVIVKGYPTEKDMAALDALADSILAKHRSLGIA
jgi:flavorubredoxin